ncbi:hypothetical protein BG015_005010, partial [Linnemannia schmuckeri]
MYKNSNGTTVNESTVVRPSDTWAFKLGAWNEFICLIVYSYPSNRDEKHQVLWGSNQVDEHPYISWSTCIPYNEKDLPMRSATLNSVILTRPVYEDMQYLELVPVITLMDLIAKMGGVIST